MIQLVTLTVSLLGLLGDSPLTYIILIKGGENMTWVVLNFLKK